MPRPTRPATEPAFPRRGEVWLVNFNPGRGSEQRGIRPALVIQNDTGNEHAATVIVAAITTTIKLYPVTVFLPAGTGGLTRDSMVNLAQLLTLDKTRLIRRLGALEPDRVGAVDRALQVSLGLD
ncbi:MAG: type II toxin-antitoxin system PemK/MazF family toxin [bacterium]